MTDRDILSKYAAPFIISSVLAILASAALLIIINASLMKTPFQLPLKNAHAKITSLLDPSANTRAEYDVIATRNLFRAKLQMEIPVPKSEKQIEEEQLLEIMKPMALKGVWLGEKKGDLCAVIDRGGQKGVWTYEVGEVVEKGLVVTDIQKNSVTLTKEDFAATLKLFSRGFERENAPESVMTAAKKVPGKTDATQSRDGKPGTASKKQDFSKDIRQEGRSIVISKSLAERIRKDNNIVMSAVAVKASVDKEGKGNGFKIVVVDKGSVAEKIGLMGNDVIQEINGKKMLTPNDVKNAQEAFKNVSKFEVKIIRGNRTKMLNYEIK